jgi:predicted RND superfamily exporter protein
MSTDPSVATAEPSPVFAAWGRFVVGHRALCLMALALITIGSLAAIVGRLGINNRLEAFAPAESAELKTLHAFRETFGYAGTFAIIIEGDVFSRPFLERLAELHRAVADLQVDIETISTAPTAPAEADFFEGDEGWGDEAAGPIMDRVTSLINVRQTVNTADGIAVQRLMDPLPDAAALPRVRAEVLADPFLVGQVVGAAGRHAVVIAKPLRVHENDLAALHAAVQATLAPFEGPGFDIMVTGLPAINAMLNTLVLRDLSVLGALSLVVVFIALIVLFRHPLGVLGPLAVVALSVLWTLGTMGLIGYDLNILSGILPSFLFVVGVCDSLHLMSIFRDRRRVGVECAQAVVEAVSITGPPVLFTSLTTMVGLFSLKFASVQAVNEMGVAGGIGVVYALILSLVLLPISLTWTGKSTLGAPSVGRQDRIHRILFWCLGRSDDRIRPGRKTKTFAVALCLAIVAGYGIGRLEVRHDDLAMLSEDAEVKLAVEAMDRHVCGAAPAQLLIDAHGSRGLKDVGLLRGIAELTRHALRYRDPRTGEASVTHANSIVDVVRETRRAFHGGDPAFYAVPEAQDEASQLLFLFESQSPDELSQVTTLDFSRAQLALRVKWRDATSYGPIVDYMRAGIDRYIGDRATVGGTGAVYLGHRIVSVLIGDLMKSFGTAFLIITVLMVFMLRDVKLGLVAMVPNLFPILLVLGLMGLSGIPMDLNNLLIASIALGIAVDDTVHFLHHFQAAFRRSGRCEEALVEARDQAGRAMFATSVLLTLGFGIFYAASTGGIRNYGMLTALTVVFAFVVDLVLLPALLRALYAEKAPAARGPE